MQKISVDLARKHYEILIERGCFKSVGAKLRELSKAQKVAVITDTNVEALYADQLKTQLLGQGFEVKVIALTPGEEHKNLASLAMLYSALADFKLTRSDLIVVLGGGIPGDIGGLAAATYLRGVPFVQIPTTLLAQIDSSIGGKVAVDLPEGKNLVGAFYHPDAVFIDPELLSTLPPRFLHDGVAEAIKYGCIENAQLFRLLETVQDDADLLAKIEDVIFACCYIKDVIVEKDELDKKERMLLNFGHTIGHAIEKAENYAVHSHGEAVGIGMLQLVTQTEKMQLTEFGSTKRLYNLLRKYELPTYSEVKVAELLEGITNDKKAKGKDITLVILERIGKANLTPIPLADLPKYIV